MKELKWIKEEFDLNRNERRAIVFLSIVFILTMIINVNTLNNYYIYNKLIISDLKTKNALKPNLPKNIPSQSKVANHLNNDASENTVHKESRHKKPKVPFKLTHKMDPNNPKEKDLLKLGLSSFAIQNWKKYIESGARIYSIDQVRKIYGISEKDLSRLELNLLFESKKKKDTLVKKKWDQKYYHSEKPKIHSIEINTADIHEWKGISGIGEVLSERIIKFKDALGGFNSIEQVAEVYGISDSLFQAIKNRLEIIPVVGKIDINNIDYENLRNHPYLSSKQARIICRYILQHGPLKSIDDFKKIKAIDENTTQRIEPYLNFSS